jgi:hypothetical protein
MAIQYPKLEHVTLPSVDGFNGSFNILRDPPKSIFTKRIDKVGQNNDINDDIDMSGDRINESIKVYARGVNPMVSVSYDNNSNNAGSFTNGGNRQAFLPYRIADKGAFRPPIRSQRDLLPLSRQPRAWFQALTNPGFADYTKKKFLPTQFRMIRDVVLKSKDVIKPNNSVKIEKPILENMKMLNAINQGHINIEAFSGKRSLDYSNFTRENVDQYKGIQENYEQVNALTNKQQYRSHNLENMAIHAPNYIGERDYYESSTNRSKQRSHGVDGISINKDRYIGETNQYETSANLSLATNQGIDGLSIHQSNYIGEKDYYESTTNPYQQKSHGLHDLSINKDKYIGENIQYQSSVNPSLRTSQGLNGLSIQESNYIGDREYYESTTNLSQQRSQNLNGLDIDEERYINEKEYYDIEANKNRDINTKTIDQLQTNNRTSVKDVIQYEVDAGKKTGYTLLTSIPDMDLEHHMPRYETYSALNDPTVYKRVEHQNEISLNHNVPQVSVLRNATQIQDLPTFDYGSSRDYKLPETLKKGQFLNDGAKPTLDRSEIQFRQDPNKEQIRKYVNNSQFDRFHH